MPKPGQYLPHFIDWMENVAYAPPTLKAAYRETIAHMKRVNRSGVRFALDSTLKGVLPDKQPLIGSDLRPIFCTERARKWPKSQGEKRNLCPIRRCHTTSLVGAESD